MLLTETTQLQELDRRLDLALASRTSREHLEIMDDYMNVNIPGLPPALRAKFRRMLHSMSYKMFAGPWDDEEAYPGAYSDPANPVVPPMEDYTFN